MKKTIYLVGIVAIIGLSSCKSKSEQANQETAAATETTTEAPAVMKIPQTTGVLSETNAWDKYIKSPKITDEERNTLKIDDIKNPSFLERPKNSIIAKGKAIYQDGSGRMETILMIIPDHMMNEYLISFNTNGEYVDCIQIGGMGLDQGTAKIEGTTVIHEITWADGDQGGKLFKQYQITPELKFDMVREWEEAVN